jgi:hypothetical protein
VICGSPSGNWSARILLRGLCIMTLQICRLAAGASLFILALLFTVALAAA